jgi:hypothetical protein
MSAAATPTAMPFKVVIDGKRTGQLWREYERRADAQAACAGLRALGMDARIVQQTPAEANGGT